MTNPYKSHSDIQQTELFFRKAFPSPKNKNFHTQLGVHFEEIVEMMDHIYTTDPDTLNKLNIAMWHLTELSNHLKEQDNVISVNGANRIHFLDGLCDQLVTATGVGYMLGMNVSGGFAEVNRSNFSKFDENDEPILDSNLKMVKGSNYFKPNLKPYI